MKSIISLTSTDKTILSFISLNNKVSSIAKIMFPNSESYNQNIQKYIKKYISLKIVKKVGRGKYDLTNEGRYILRHLRTLSGDRSQNGK